MHSIGIYGCYFYFLDIYFTNIMVPLLGKGAKPPPQTKPPSQIPPPFVMTQINEIK